MNHLNNPKNEQDVERPPHFKDVFNSNDPSSTNPDNCINTNNIVTSESRRPSLVVIPVNKNSTSNSSMIGKNHNTSTSNNNNNNNNTNSHMIIGANNTSKNIALHNNNDNKPKLQSLNKSNEVLKSEIKSSNKLNKSNLHFNQQLISNFQMLKLPSNHLHNNANINNGIIANKKFSSSKSTKHTTPCKRFRSKSLPNIFIPSKRSHQILLEFHRHPNNSKIIQNHLYNHQRQNQNLGPIQNQHQITVQQQHLQQQHLQQQQQQQQQMLLLPPVNLHSMHEIDLQEVLKNPQLRHDILFDPQLQFRPNLDGERGKKKKIQSANYWNMIKFETESLLNSKTHNTLDENSPIILMFQCLKSILISLIPSKDIALIDEILDVNLLIQQLNSKCFNFVGFSNWISSIFKLHCAPMRDSLVDELNVLFDKAVNVNSENQINIDYLIEGFKTLFSILEAMKLDVANHQIRILRPLLCSSAISFEKEYFKNSVKCNKINFQSSKLWFKKNSTKINSNNNREILNYSILNLLSCSNMTRQFPNTLIFDHTRLLLLRADIRHIICTKLCSILYKNLIYQYKLEKSLLSDENILQFRNEILNIIVDENGNSKWTKNLKNLSVHIVNKLFKTLDSSKIDFAYNWLLKQTQPNSNVYSILESKIFEKILPSLSKNSSCSSDFSNLATASMSNSANSANSENSKINDDIIINNELINVVERLNQLIEFNYNVFNELYSTC